MKDTALLGGMNYFHEWRSKDFFQINDFVHICISSSLPPFPTIIVKAFFDPFTNVPSQEFFVSPHFPNCLTLPVLWSSSLLPPGFRQHNLIIYNYTSIFLHLARFPSKSVINFHFLTYNWKFSQLLKLVTKFKSLAIWMLVNLPI